MRAAAFIWILLALGGCAARAGLCKTAAEDVELRSSEAAAFQCSIDQARKLEPSGEPAAAIGTSAVTICGKAFDAAFEHESRCVIRSGLEYYDDGRRRQAAEAAMATVVRIRAAKHAPVT